MSGQVGDGEFAKEPSPGARQRALPVTGRIALPVNALLYALIMFTWLRLRWSREKNFSSPS